MEKDKKYKLKRNAIISGILTIAIGASVGLTQCHKDNDRDHEHEESSTTSISNTLEILDDDNTISIETSKSVKPIPIPDSITTPDVENITPEEVTTKNNTTRPVETTAEQTTLEFTFPTFPTGPVQPGSTNPWDIIKPGTSTRPSEIQKPNETTNNTTKSSEVITIDTTKPPVQTSTTIDTTKPPVETTTSNSSQRPVTPPPYSSDTEITYTQTPPTESKTPEPEPTPSESKKPEPEPTSSETKKPEPEPTPSESKTPEPEPTPTESKTPEPEPTPTESKTPEPEPEPTHEHKWITKVSYKPNNDGTHTIITIDTCECGETKRTEITVSCKFSEWVSAEDQGEKRKCPDCEYIQYRSHDFKDTTSYEYAGNGQHKEITSHDCKTCDYVAPNTEKLVSCNPGSPELAPNGNDVQTTCGDCRHVEVIHSHNTVTIKVPSTTDDVCYINVTKCADPNCPLPPTEVRQNMPHNWVKDPDTYNPFEGTIDEVCDTCNKSRTVPYTDGIDNTNSLLVKDVLCKYREYLVENRKLNSVLYTEDLIDKKFYVEEPKKLKYKSRY